MLSLKFFSIILFSSISILFKLRSSRLRMLTYSSSFLLRIICLAFSFSILRILAFFFSSSSYCFFRLFSTFSRRSAFNSCLSAISNFLNSYIAFIRFVICSECSTYELSDLRTSCIYASLLREITFSCLVPKSR